MQDRGGTQKVHIVLPAYNAASTIPLVAEELPVEAADRALLVDDQSPDETSAVALRDGLHRRPPSPATAATAPTRRPVTPGRSLDGADIVVMVHADNQYDPALVAEMVRPILEGRADVVIGSRLLEDETIAGGMPRWKWVGNRFLTGSRTAASGASYSEYHTGYRAFSVDFLRRSRSCATATASSSTRRSSPRSWPATRA